MGIIKTFRSIFSSNKIQPDNISINKPVAMPGNGNPIIMTNTWASSFDGSKFPGALDNMFGVETIPDLHSLRAQSQKLNISNTIARSAINTKTTTVINDGLKLEAKPVISILEQDGRTVPENWDKNVEDRFNIWGSSKGADYTFKKNFYQMQNQAYEKLLIDGEVLGILRFKENNKRGRVGRLNIQLVPVKFLKTPANKLEAVRKKGGDIIDGKEIDNTGTIIAYYIWPSNLKMKRKQWIRVPRWAEKSGRLNVVHMFTNTDPDAVSGIPFLTPVIHDLDKLEKYRVAEIQAAVVNASIALIQNSDGDQPNSSMLTQGVGKKSQTILNSDGSTDEAVTATLVKPGVHLYATRAGQKLDSYDTKRPNVNFDSFVGSVSKHVASALGIPVEILQKMFNNNFSASRAALLEFWRYVTSDRVNFSYDFNQPIYKEWLNDEILQGRVKAGGWNNVDKTQQNINRAAWSNTTWHGIAKGSVDPLKEVRALTAAEERGWTTGERNSRELFGSSFDNNVDRRKKEVIDQREIQLSQGG